MYFLFGFSSDFLSRLIYFVICESDLGLLIIYYYIELTHSKTLLEITVEIEQQPAVLDFKNLSQYFSRSK